MISAGTEIDDIFKLTEGKRKSEILTCLVKLTKEHIKVGTEEELQAINYDQNKKRFKKSFSLVQYCNSCLQK